MPSSLLLLGTPQTKFSLFNLQVEPVFLGQFALPARQSYSFTAAAGTELAGTTS